MSKWNNFFNIIMMIYLILMLYVLFGHTLMVKDLTLTSKTS